MAHRPYAGNFHLGDTPELGSELPSRDAVENEIVFLRRDRKCGLIFPYPMVQCQNMALRCFVYPKPMTSTGEQWKPVDLTGAVTIALLVHRLKVPIFVVVLWPYAVFPVFEERLGEDMVYGCFRPGFYLLPATANVDSAEMAISRKYAGKLFAIVHAFSPVLSA